MMSLSMRVHLHECILVCFYEYYVIYTYRQKRPCSSMHTENLQKQPSDTDGEGHAHSSGFHLKVDVIIMVKYGDDSVFVCIDENVMKNWHLTLQLAAK